MERAEVDASIARVLFDAAREHPDRVALVDYAHGREEVTYADLDGGARAVAGRLRRDGVPSGCRVALMAGNSRAFVEAWFGVVYAGCAVVPIPVLSAPPEIAFRLGHARCDAVYTDDERREVVQRAVDQLGSPVTVRDVASLTRDVTPWA